ncbi:Sorting nexin mvp1 [Apophysomyces ossiformis]|uniref:Sorting nexin MVP1 n=1 Tax=Apophysomyces ossiformis TaxID=679940 RepID=A0A8H7BK04_9FUNG|nr:Sorting nexin mvp1 [Apophysomyces ossiformis]
MMLDEDDVMGSGFLDTTGSKYLLDSQTFQQSFTSPLFAVGDDDQNPWEGSFDPVADVRQTLTTTNNAVDNHILDNDLTAANVLVGIDLPEIYDTAFIRGGPVNNRLSVSSLETIIRLSGLSHRAAEEVIHLVVPPSALHVTREEFNTFLALIGCAQKNMELSLETVYHHRNDLPVPVLPHLDELRVKRPSPTVAKESPKAVEDPWAPPPKPRKLIDTTTLINGNKSDIANTIKAVTSTRAVNGRNQNNTLSADDDRKLSIQSYKWFEDMDQIKVTLASEKEGFIFKHVNYVVESQQRSSIVSRRYSDFYWLWEMLIKRYPFRVIPNLPPKKLGGGDAFLETRRKGLARFINNVVRHPCLKKDEVVNTFLSEPSELLAWRRANPPTTDEEFVRKSPNTDELEDYIPSDLDDRLAKLENKLPRIVEHYTMMCLVMERMIRLTEAHGTEYVRYSITLNAMSELEQNCYVAGCQACGSVVRGYETVAKHIQHAGSILDDHATASIRGVLENIKRQRDIFISFKEMLERRSKLAINQIDTLAKKLEANKAKVVQNDGVPGLEAEVERLEAAIHTGYERMMYQKRRDIYIRFCLASELSFLHKQQAFVSHLYQDFVHGELQFSRSIIDNWKTLQSLTCDPLQPDEFA